MNPVDQARILASDEQADDAPIKLVVFADLDNSLFTSLRKQTPETALLQAAALLSNGEVISTTSPLQRRFLRWLMQDALLVPVTARSTSAFARVLLKFEGPAILSFGGVIHDHQGRVDEPWAAHMAAQLTPFEADLQMVCERIEQHFAEHGEAGRTRVVRENGVVQYTVAKHSEGDLASLAQLRADWLDAWVAAQPALCLHQNANNVSVQPRVLDKAPAVAYLTQKLKAEYGEILTLGLGDSDSDAAFLALCDYAITPRSSQLNERWFGQAAR